MDQPDKNVTWRPFQHLKQFVAAAITSSKRFNAAAAITATQTTSVSAIIWSFIRAAIPTL